MNSNVINKSIFSLFHHNVFEIEKGINYSSDRLFELSNSRQPQNNLQDLSRVIFEIVTSKIQDFSDQEITHTLTGGMDSRIVLACLLKAGIKPNCLTFGNPNTQDVVIAKQIAKSFNLPFHNACQEKPTKEWYYKWVIETIKRDRGNSHLHRAHRTAAIAEHVEKFNPKILFTGHMGGEGLKGFTYNNYLTSPFFELVNEGKEYPLSAAKQVLHNYFLKTENIDFNQLIREVQRLPWMRKDQKSNKFFFQYDLAAKIHHAQDIRLYNSYVPNVVPVYLQNEYLEALFTSPYNFLFKSDNILNRLKNPEFSCKVIEEIYPPLLDFPFASGFTPREYLKGLWHYVPVKLYRDYNKKKKYPPTFSYGQWYVDFVKEHSQNISQEIWEIYDKDRYMKDLETNKHRQDEGYWHKFSNPIFFDLVNKTL